MNTNGFKSFVVRTIALMGFYLGHSSPQAKALFWNSIEEMIIDDVWQIYNGSENSATQYVPLHGQN